MTPRLVDGLRVRRLYPIRYCIVHDNAVVYDEFYHCVARSRIGYSVIDCDVRDDVCFLTYEIGDDLDYEEGQQR